MLKINFKGIYGSWGRRKRRIWVRKIQGGKRWGRLLKKEHSWRGVSDSGFFFFGSVCNWNCFDKNGSLNAKA